jgi:hypothetical protein
MARRTSSVFCRWRSEEVMVKSEYFVYVCLLRQQKTGAIGEGKILVVVLTEEGFGGSPDHVIDMQYLQRT